MIVAAIPTDVATLAAALFLLLGVPAILLGMIMLYTGYVRYDAEQYLEALEELEESADDDVPPVGQDATRATDDADPSAENDEFDRQ
ncbi:hypothetical protein [Natrarchaeobaculum aegyptiacum]|uniref:Preprotein translocase subunit TatA n=1 Tax=Natrarchaeobaculum aegyptiacum TaxID=745377 RepID=A0A2Z2HNS7_9EURY|nr:hypothetical protein [Natrarchaeobaculum aegyptiacum]ARS88626.1 hypothetical protein B1756_01860 [Natrarchaeobaculum aegyptiacum]